MAIAALQQVPLGETFGIAIEVRVVVDVLALGVVLVDAEAAQDVPVDLGDAPVARREHRRTALRHDVERAVDALAARS
jgi:hypothetical protein